MGAISHIPSTIRTVFSYVLVNVPVIHRGLVSSWSLYFLVFPIIGLLCAGAAAAVLHLVQYVPGIVA